MAAVGLGDGQASGSSAAAVVDGSRGGVDLQQGAAAEAAMQLVLVRANAAAAALRGVLHEADLVTLAAGG